MEEAKSYTAEKQGRANDDEALARGWRVDVGECSASPCLLDCSGSAPPCDQYLLK